MQDETRKAAYYITQYATYNSDEGVYEALEYWINKEDIDEDNLVELFGLMGQVSDSINEKVYMKLMTLSDSGVEKLLDLYNAITDGNLNDLDDVMNYVVFETLEEEDIKTPEEWYDYGDQSLRDMGADSNAIYWIKDLDLSYDYAQINVYLNGFEYMDELEVINFVLDRCLDDWLDALE